MYGRSIYQYLVDANVNGTGYYNRYVPHARQLFNQLREAERRRMSMTPTVRLPPPPVRLPPPQMIPLHVHVNLPEMPVSETFYSGLGRILDHTDLNIRPIPEEKIIELLQRDVINFSQKLRILTSHHAFGIVLEKYTVVQKATVADVENNDICSVCLAEYEQGTITRKLKCDHVFHKECIDRWLSIYLTCPLCRRGLMGNKFEISDAFVRDEDVPLPRQTVPQDILWDATIAEEPFYVENVMRPHMNYRSTGSQTYQNVRIEERIEEMIQSSLVVPSTTLYNEQEAPGSSSTLYQYTQSEENYPEGSYHPIDCPSYSPVVSRDYDTDDEEENRRPSPPPYPSTSQSEDWQQRRRLTLLIRRTDQDGENNNQAQYSAEVFENDIPIMDPEEPAEEELEEGEYDEDLDDDDDDVQIIEAPVEIIEIPDEETPEVEDANNCEANKKRKSEDEGYNNRKKMRMSPLNESVAGPSNPNGVIDDLYLTDTDDELFGEQKDSDLLSWHQDIQKLNAALANIRRVSRNEFPNSSENDEKSDDDDSWENRDDGSSRSDSREESVTDAVSCDGCGKNTACRKFRDESDGERNDGVVVEVVETDDENSNNYVIVVSDDDDE